MYLTRRKIIEQFPQQSDRFPYFVYAYPNPRIYITGLLDRYPGNNDVIGRIWFLQSDVQVQSARPGDNSDHAQVFGLLR